MGAALAGGTEATANLLGEPVTGLEAEGARGCAATAIGLAMSGLRASAFVTGEDLKVTGGMPAVAISSATSTDFMRRA